MNSNQTGLLQTYYTEYLSLYYKSDEAVRSDPELQAWWDEAKVGGAWGCRSRSAPALVGRGRPSRVHCRFFCQALLGPQLASETGIHLPAQPLHFPFCHFCSVQTKGHPDLVALGGLSEAEVWGFAGEHLCTCAARSTELPHLSRAALFPRCPCRWVRFASLPPQCCC